MERINNSLNNMRDGHSVGRSQLSAASNNNNSNNNNNNNNNYYGRDMLSKFSWPPRPYTCSFCKREFRSAQALGGHMNVHRRDRARLRLSSPSDDHHHHQSHLKLSPNPNPSFNYSSSPSSSSAYSKPFTHNFPPFSSGTTTPSGPSITLSSLSSSAHEEKIPTMFCSSFDSSSSKNNDKRGNFTTKTTVKSTYFEVGELKGFIHEDNDDHDYSKNLKKGDNIVTLDLEIGLSSMDDLDLELRLGYS